jgi:hypothetical protein
LRKRLHLSWVILIRELTTLLMSHLRDYNSSWRKNAPYFFIKDFPYLFKPNPS